MENVRLQPKTLFQINGQSISLKGNWGLLAKIAVSSRWAQRLPLTSSGLECHVPQSSVSFCHLVTLHLWLRITVDQLTITQFNWNIHQLIKLTLFITKRTFATFFPCPQLCSGSTGSGFASSQLLLILTAPVSGKFWKKLSCCLKITLK